MRNLVPAFILEQMGAGRPAGECIGAALFVDLSGFTRMTEVLMQHGQLGAEALAVVMRRVFDPLIERVERRGGFVAGFAGDAFLALFIEAEETARSALAVAWEMQAWMEANPQFDTPYGAFAIAAKIGLAEDRVEWGVLQSEDERRAVYYFRGPAVDASAEVQGLAERGQIMLTPQMAGAAGGMAVLAAVEGAACLRLIEINGPLPPERLTPAHAPDLALVGRFVLPEVAAQSVSGEFRYVAAVFIRLHLPQGDAAPDASGELAAFVRRVFALQDRYGGLLNGLKFGDKGANLLLFWGAPASFENDMARAAGFLLELRGGCNIPFSAGVTYRIAHAGFIGGAQQEDYTCYGRGTNLAARLMTSAPSGAIWLDEPAAQRAGAAFTLEFRGAQPFKGFDQDLAVYALTGRSADAGPSFRGQLVGRQEELARLDAFVAPLRAGRSPGMLAIWGEAGMGKSRLLHAFLNGPGGPVAQGWLVALCPSDQILRRSLNPFRYWLRRYFDQADDRSPVENRRNFEGRLDALIAGLGAAGGSHAPESRAALAAELERTRPFLAALLELPAPGALYEQLDARGRFDNTLLALMALLLAESLRRPVIVCLEDALWLDEDSQVFLAQFVRFLATDEGASYPLALLAAARPEPHAVLLGEAIPFEQIELAGLPATGLAELAEGILGAPAAEPLLALLAARAEGNPFFAEQMVRHLQESDSLEHADAGWRLRADADAARMPGDIQALLVARLDRLAAAVRSVVQTASVLGREFEVRVLSQMLRGDMALSRHVAQAEGAAIWSNLDALRYLFRHALLRDAAYDMQVRARLVELHALAAAGIEVVYSADLAPHYPDLAYHYGQVGDAPAERRYSRLAGERAASQFANAEAHRFLGRALDLTPPEDHAGRYALLDALERVYDVLGLREDQAECLDGMAAAAAALNDRGLMAEAALRRANYARVTGDHTAALAYVEQAAADAATPVAARAHALRARLLLHTGDYAGARLWLTRALESAADSGEQRVTAQAIYDLGISDYYQDRFAEALEYFRQAQPLYHALADRRGEINSLLMFGTVQSLQGDHAAAHATLNEALELCHAIGWRHGESYILGNLANSYFDLGDYAATRRLHEQALALARAVGDREGEAASLSTLALVAQRQGGAAEALPTYRQALEIQRAIGYRRGEGYTLTGMGHALADLGRLEEAEAAFGAALEIRRALEPDGPLAVDDLAGLARVALLRGDGAEAIGRATEAADRMANRGETGVESPALAWLICYRAFAADPAARARAADALGRGLALLQRQADAIHDEALRRAFLEAVPFNRELVELSDAG
jgi:class 3 adenylate cyclase/tetratricopeptide (TPR) repeat protein